MSPEPVSPEPVSPEPTGAARTLDLLARGRVVAIMRGDYRGREEEVAAVLTEAGVPAVEVTLNSPNALAAVARLSDALGRRTAVGVGTVLRPEDVEKAADAGAQFVVSPNRNVAVIERTKRLGMASLPGCYTPSEIVEAFAAGADAAKLFPARALGPAFVRDVRAPLGDVRLVPTGGVTAERAGEYVAAGAWAVGVGSELVNASVFDAGGLDALRRRAEAFVAAVASRGGIHAAG